MHARVTTVTIQRDKVDEAIQYLRGHGAELRRMKGFHDFLYLVDRATGKSTILSLWDGEADLKAVETSGYYQTRLAEMAPLFAGQPTREVCEVAVEDIAKLGEGAHAARATTLVFQPGKTDEATRVVRDSIVPAARQQKGSNGLLCLVDRTMGKGITYSFWATEADLKVSETSGYYKTQLAKILPLSSGQPVRDVFELTLPTLTPPPVGQMQPHAPTP
jgi:quinol monooxygenase YgiN